jgi:hypothetical protein
MPNGLNASISALLIFFEIISETSLRIWNFSPASRWWAKIAPSLSGTNVCAVQTNSNRGFSISGNRSEPTMTAAAPSPNNACPTRFSKWVSLGPQNAIVVTSEQTTNTRAPLLFSA